MAEITKMKLEDWLDDLCVRFIINLPKEELESVERICFQVEEAQWFYEDFIRPIDPALPSLTLRNFCLRIFQHCPMFSGFSFEQHAAAFDEFLAYKTRVPVRGAIMLNETMDQVVLVKGWKKSGNWSFPRGKINKDERDIDCAIREVYEETGFDLERSGLVGVKEEVKHLEVTLRDQNIRLYVFRGIPMDTYFEPRTRKEISKVQWHRLAELPAYTKAKNQVSEHHEILTNANKFYMVAPFLVPLKKWINKQLKLDAHRAAQQQQLSIPVPIDGLLTEEEPMTEHEQYIPPQPYLRPENSMQATQTIMPHNAPPSNDGSEALLRMLTNSSAKLSQPSIDAPQENKLLALLKGSSNLPHTPLDQVDSTPAPPLSPKHHHHHAHYPHVSHSQSQQPPPSFPIATSHAIQQLQQSLDLPPPSRAPQWGGSPQQPPVQANLQSPLALVYSNPISTSSRQLSTQQAPQQPWSIRPSPGLQFQETKAPTIPAPSDLPPPKLTAQSLALLDVFKSGKVSAQPARVTNPEPVSSMQTVISNVSSRAEPKPISLQQSTLLDLFRTASATGQQQQQQVRKSSQPTMNSSAMPKYLKHDQPRKSEEEINYPSATVTVPRKHISSPMRASSGTRRHQPAAEAPSTAGRTSHPQSPAITILPRPSSSKRNQPHKPSTTHLSHEQVELHQRQPPNVRERPKSASKTNGKPSKSFQPQILQRPKDASSATDTRKIDQQHQLPPALLSSRGKDSAPRAQEEQESEQRPSQNQPQDQKDMLLSLFTKQANKSTGAGNAAPVLPTFASSSRGQETEPSLTGVSKHEVAPAASPKLDFFGRKGAALSGHSQEPLSPSAAASPISPQDRQFMMNYLQQVAKQAKR